MSPSQLIAVAFKVFNNRGQVRGRGCKTEHNFLATALDSWKASTQKRSEPTQGRAQEECPRLKSKTMKERQEPPIW